MNNNSKRRLLITGIAGDIGGYVADEYTKMNWLVFGLDKRVPDMNLNNSNIICRQCDLTNFQETEKTIDEISEKHGIFDAVVNCAGMIANSPIVAFSEGKLTCHDSKLWETVIASNLTSAFYTTACAVKQMVGSRKKGVIINISSICASGNPGQAAYSAAKAGLNGMTKALAKEIAPFGIRVVGLSPGFFNTNSTKENLSAGKLKNITGAIPLKRLGHLKEIVSTIQFIIQNEYVNGKIIELDGGLVI